MARENLLLNGAQIQRVRHLLIILAVPDGKEEEEESNDRQPIGSRHPNHGWAGLFRDLE